MSPDTFRPGRVALFLVPTFALSWGIDVLFEATTGLRVFLDLGMKPPGIFVPAAVAILSPTLPPPG